jgi:hypothetical protein
MFPPDPQFGDQVEGLDGAIWRWDGTKWEAFDGGKTGQFRTVPEAPDDGRQYGRQSRKWTPIIFPENPLDAVPGLNQAYGVNGHTREWVEVLALSGGTMRGRLVLNADPASPQDAATMRWVQAEATRAVTLANGYTAAQINDVRTWVNDQLATVNDRFLDWSFQEQDTGRKWLDGSSVFFKTWQIPISAITPGEDSYVPHELPQLGFVLFVNAYSYDYGSLDHARNNFPYVDAINPYLPPPPGSTIPDDYGGAVAFSESMIQISLGHSYAGLNILGDFLYVTALYTKVRPVQSTQPQPPPMSHQEVSQGASQAAPEPPPPRPRNKGKKK